MKILIAPDKFKGSLGAKEVAAAIRRGFERVIPEAACREVPIADGGEGTAEILHAVLGGEWIAARCRAPLGEPILAGYAMLAGGTAAINMSEASGLFRVPPARRDVWRSSTYGTGELIADAVRRGARKLLIGLGGSATNDGGVGLAAALGYEFVDQDGQPLPPLPVHFERLANIRRTRLRFPVGELEVIGLCDVENPLLGEAGATRVYGPQKGVAAGEMNAMEAGLKKLADIVARDLRCDHRDTPGAGAAGGLGFGLMSFGGACLRPGFETVADALNLPDAVRWCDLVVTGEGRLDAQTIAGKGPAGVAGLARRLGKPVVAFAGSIPDPAAIEPLFGEAVSLVDAETSLERALSETAGLLEARAARFALTRLARVVTPSEIE